MFGSLLRRPAQRMALRLARVNPITNTAAAVGVRWMSNDAKKPLNKYSAKVTNTATMGAGQAMLFGTGMNEADMSRAQVQIASMWWSGNPCNAHLRDLGDAVAAGVKAAGCVPMQINTIGISDAISMGTNGMSYSLPSRDLIADSIEMSMAGMWYDANISIPGCDKNMPGAIMAMARMNRPSIMVYGGSILPGCTSAGTTIDVATTMESFGMLVAGKITSDQRNDMIRNACPGPGGCGGMYTANTSTYAFAAGVTAASHCI